MDKTHIKTSQKARKRNFLAFLVLLFFGMVAFTRHSLLENASFIVVLDAGHGGSDPGNLGTGRYKTTEKNISLDVTLQVGKYINEHFPGVKVVYTRNGDTFPTLKERCNIANNADADLFISIHCNANAKESPNGVETFVMGLHKSQESLESAMRENNSIFLEKDHEADYSGFDPKNPDTYIILSMRENAYMEKSIDIAKNIQDQFRSRVGRKDRGVKQAGFYVISYTNMPSILVELGFLTNKDEEDFLQSKDGKTYMASAIFRAFKDYMIKNKPDTKPLANIKDPEIKSIPYKDSPPSDNTPKSPNNAAANAIKDKNEKPAVAATKAEPVWKSVDKGVRYHIQILSSATPLKAGDQQFKSIGKTIEYKQNGVFKYLVGTTDNYKEAKQMQEQMRDRGFKDAFIVAFEDDKRIDLSKAIAQTTNIKNE
jgi:N-acetylmuramoyl-L-alanine amidase